jgi:uncharacterized protein
MAERLGGLDPAAASPESAAPTAAASPAPALPRSAAAPTTTSGRSTRRLWALLVIGALLWTTIYFANRPLWDLVFHDVVGLDAASRLGHAVHFFFYDVVKIMLLVTGLIFVVGMIRASISPERVRAVLAGRRALTGYFIAAGFGALTPFCACSSVPLFIGFVAAGIPMGVTLTFLITSPLINQVGVVMLLGMFGWQVPVLYVVTGMSMAIIAGLALSRLDLDRWVEPFVFASPVGQIAAADGKPTLHERVEAAREEVADITKRIWPYVLVGIAIGAAIHGWVPAGFFAAYAGPDNALAVPVATLVGAPLYANVASVVPLVEALHGTGMALGTVMAFMMSVVALSVPSFILLRRVLKLPLLLLFHAAVVVGILVIGLLFNLTT